MKNILDFFVNIGKLKRKERRGWLLHEIKNPESTAGHIFRTALLAWILGKKKSRLNLAKVIKMALIHDLCEVYAFDATPYDPLLPKSLKNKKKIREILKKWPTFTLKEKKKKEAEKLKEESRALTKLIAKLPPEIKTEIKHLWTDFSKGLSPEGRFVRQIDKAENYFQGIEYWKKYGRIQVKLWKRWSREIFDDPLVLNFIRAIEAKFLKKLKNESC